MYIVDRKYKRISENICRVEDNDFVALLLWSMTDRGEFGEQKEKTMNRQESRHVEAWRDARDK